MATEIKCKDCGGIIEFKPGIPLNPQYIQEWEKEDPKCNFCFNCRKKWSEKNLKCNSCKSNIEMHEKKFHNGLCDNCFRNN